MNEENDWRLLNDVEYLMGAYLDPAGGDDICKNAPHLGHCIFCWDDVHDDRYEWWYIPEDISCCICEKCFNDFKDRFGWKKLNGYDINWSLGREHFGGKDMKMPFATNIYRLNTPCYLVSETALRRNMEILLSVRKRTGCKILLAQKAFSMFAAYPLMRPYLDGTTASGLYEARLGHEEFGGETHVFSPAYKPEDMERLVTFCDDIIFNSFSQWRLHRDTVRNSGRRISCGIRCNPLYSEIETDIYDPCFTGSRLGVTPENFESGELDGIEGLHFHTMCEQGADVLARTVPHIEKHFGAYLGQMKWLNLGGGHHITREGYDTDLLCKTVDYLQQKYGVQVYLEPGEACALNAGWLVTEVLDIGRNGVDIAIVDASAACHMPDVLEMPYRPKIIGAGQPGEKAHTYRLGGPTCLAGDIIGDYSFDEPLKPGDRPVLCDMAIYSMCKNNTFNGMPLPDIYLEKLDGSVKLVKRFGYEDFKGRNS